MQDVTKVPAIGYSITANIDGHRQVVFQHFIAADASDEEVNRDIDRIMRLVDRQRAIYELPEMREEIHRLREEVSQYNEDMATQAEANFGKAQAELHVQLETLNKDRKTFYDAAYSNHANSGRRGPFEPKGQTRVQLDRFDAGIKQVTEALAKNEAERDFFMTNTRANIQRRQDRITVLEAKIAEREALAP